MSLTDKLLDIEKGHLPSLFHSDEAASGPENASDGSLDIQPSSAQIHQSVAALLVEGLSPQSIADRLKIDVGKVKTLLKQAHTQQAIKELVAGQESQAVQNILKASEVDTILTVIQVRDDPNAGAQQRLSACKILIEAQRGKKPYGKEDEGAGLEGADLAERVGEIDKKIAEAAKKQVS